MNQTTDKAINKLLGIEEGYSDHASDPGGKTRYGITEKVARAHGYDGEMKNLPLSLAKQIYGEDYWDEINLDAIAAYSVSLAYELFEFGVNASPSKAAKSLQRSLNAFNKKQEYYDDIAVDGAVGPKTLSAWASFLDVRGEEGIEVMIKAVNVLQGYHYLSLSESNEKFEDFVYGWIRERIEFNSTFDS